MLHNTRVLIEHLISFAVTLYLSDVFRYNIKVSIDFLPNHAEHVVRHLAQFCVELVSKQFHACTQVFAESDIFVSFFEVLHHVIE